MLDADQARRSRPSLAKACVAAGIVNAQGTAVARESLRGYIQLMDACAPEGGWPLTLSKPQLAGCQAGAPARVCFTMSTADTGSATV